MSLFPAYSSVASSDENVSQKNESKTGKITYLFV